MRMVRNFGRRAEVIMVLGPERKGKERNVGLATRCGTECALGVAGGTRRALAATGGMHTGNCSKTGASNREGSGGEAGFRGNRKGAKAGWRWSYDNYGYR